MKTINKILVVAFILIGVAVKAQISVQTDPEATINQENPFLDASKYNNFGANIGKGLYFPRTNLTTWEFNTNTISVGLFSSCFDGMVVYNTATGQTIADPNKGGIQVEVTPGFYYFNNPNATAPGGSVATGKWERILSAENTSMGEPWQVSGTTDPASSNTQDIYQMGKVGVGTTTPETELEVVGEIRARDTTLYKYYYTSLITKDEIENREPGVGLYMGYKNRDVNGVGSYEWRLKLYERHGFAIENGAGNFGGEFSRPLQIYPAYTNAPQNHVILTGKILVRENETHTVRATQLSEAFTVRGNVQLPTIQSSPHNDRSTLKVVVTDSTGILKTKNSLYFRGPWSISTLNSPATGITQNIYRTGNVGIGTTLPPTEKLEVIGNVKATSFISGTTTYPDYVFEKYYKGFSKFNNDYTFKTLTEVEAFIKENGHLPGYKPASEIIKKGSFNISESHLTNVEKIEELYLYTIEQDKKIKAQQKEIEELKAQNKRIEKLETLVKQLLKNK